MLTISACSPISSLDISQGNDKGTQYRSAIFFHGDAQREAATASMADQQKHHSKPIATQIVPATTFYAAEEYHQQYLAKVGLIMPITAANPGMQGGQSPKKGCTDPIACYGLRK